MRSATAATLLTLFFISAQTGVTPAQSGVSLKALAVRDGYTMQWLLPERSVSLVRPGTVIVLDPGVSMYYVNDRIEFSDRVPLYRNGDVIVSSKFAARLTHLAAARQRAAASASAPRGTAAEQPVSGTVSLTARPLQGRQAIVVNGHAPSSAPVTITLLATFDPEIPTVVVGRHDVQPDVNGNFQAEIPLAPDYVQNTNLRVIASSGSGTAPASADLVVGAPNAGVVVPLEQRLNPIP